MRRADHTTPQMQTSAHQQRQPQSPPHKTPNTHTAQTPPSPQRPHTTPKRTPNAPLTALTLALMTTTSCQTAPAPLTPLPSQPASTSNKLASSHDGAPCIVLPDVPSDDLTPHLWRLPTGIGICLTAAYKDPLRAKERTCHALSPDPQAPQNLKVGPWTPPTNQATLRPTGDHQLEACPGNARPCVTIQTVAHLNIETWFNHAAYHPRLERVAVLTSAYPDSEYSHHLEIHDLKQGRLLAKVPMSQDESMVCGSVQWYGDMVGVWTNVCAGPGGSVWWADAETGRKRAEIPTPDFNTYDGRAALNKDGLLGVLTWQGADALIVDPQQHKILHQESLRALYPGMGEGDAPNSVVALSDGSLAFAIGGEHVGTVWVWRPDGSTQQWQAPVCKP